MFTGKYFSYDGISSEDYGLIISDFGKKTVTETNAFSDTLRTTKPNSSGIAYHNGYEKNPPPPYEFSVISEKHIPDELRREILNWLVGRETYKKLEIHQADLEGYYYNCVFSQVSIIYVNGRCHGFRLTANFDSKYARGDDIVVDVTSGDGYITINVESDIVDDYIYPKIDFRIANGRISREGGNIPQNAIDWIDENIGGDTYNLVIVNKTDGEERPLIFAGADEYQLSRVHMDGETLTITTDREHFYPTRYFNKNWLRLRKGINELEVYSMRPIKIIIPTYVMIGF